MKSWIKRAGISFFFSIIFLFVSCVSVLSYLHIIYVFHQDMYLIIFFLIILVSMYFVSSSFYILAIKKVWVGYDKEREEKANEEFKS